MQKITREILEENPILALQYSVTEGHQPCGTVWFLVKERYGSVGFDQVLVVSGAQQGICLTAHCLLDDGDKVISESPSFIGSLNAFRSFRSQLVGVEMGPDGIDTEKLEQVLKANPNTKFIYTIPNFQNPTGITMSLEKRKEVYRLALQYGVLIWRITLTVNCAFLVRMYRPSNRWIQRGSSFTAEAFPKYYPLACGWGMW